MEIQITKRFTDSVTSQLYGAGTYDLHPNLARRFQAEGKGRVTDKNMADMIDAAVIAQGGKVHEAPEPEAPKTESTGKAAQKSAPVESSTAQVSGETPLPEGFPERDLLAENGFSTIQSLSEEGVDEKLAGFLTKGKVNKVGQALNKLRGE